MGEKKVLVAELPVMEHFDQDSHRNVYLSDLPYILKPTEIQHDKIPARRVSVNKDIKNLGVPVELLEETTVGKDIWSILAQVSPTYNYRSLSHGDPGSIASLNETESGKFSYSGGLQLGIKATKRLSLFAGFMYSQIGFEIRNVISYQAVIQKNFGSEIFEDKMSSTNLYSFSNSTGLISSDKSNNTADIVPSSGSFSNSTAQSFQNNSITNRIDNTGILTSSDKIDQFFQFIELPFMLRYKVINRKLKMNLLGGLSTNVLIGNRVLLITDDSKSRVGETEGIRTVNYSTNLGFGFDYDLGKNFLFSIEPQFKYYLNSINENLIISSRPYSIGMFAGVRYIF